MSSAQDFSRPPPFLPPPSLTALTQLIPQGTGSRGGCAVRDEARGRYPVPILRSQISIPDPDPRSSSRSPDPGHLRGSGAGRAGRSSPVRPGDTALPQ